MILDIDLSEIDKGGMHWLSKDSGVTSDDGFLLEDDNSPDRSVEAFRIVAKEGLASGEIERDRLWRERQNGK